MKISSQKGSVSIVVGLILLIVIAAIGLTLTARKDTNKITNKGYTYSVEIDGASSSEKEGVDALISADKTLVISISPSSTNVSIECKSTRPMVADIVINSVTYPICKITNPEIYVTSFKSENQWHTVTVLSPDNKRTITTSEIQNIVRKISVNK